MTFQVGIRYGHGHAQQPPDSLVDTSTRRLVAALAVGVLVLAACGDDDDDDAGPGDDRCRHRGAETTAAPDGTRARHGVDGAAETSGDDGGDGGEVVVGARARTDEPRHRHRRPAPPSTPCCSTTSTRRCSSSTRTATIGPGLAELPEVSDDGTVYTFTLQDGVTFHSGEPLTSADVVWSLEAQRAEGANEAARLASIATVEAPDDQTVVVTLTQPDNDFTYLMTRRGGAVLQADATGLENSANGTGPFTFDEWNVGSSITLARNDDYWGEAPAISGVTFPYFTDPNAAVNAFTTGDVDILTGINTDLVGSLQENPDYVVTEGTTNGEFTLGFNNKQEPFTDPTVRKAIRQAIDKDAYLELQNGFGTIIGGPVPPSDPWYEDLTDVAPYDPTAAAAALEAAGLRRRVRRHAGVAELLPDQRRRVRRAPSWPRSASTSRSRRSSSRCGWSRCTRTTTTT